ncbi:hypothetical protein [Escherichia coli]|uniref:hypothetical protein n=1 Tax=Escherichia coli TaxID=562 RepID=UPI003A88F24B
MINNIANQSSFPAATIDSQMLLKMVNEARRLRGEKEVRNNDFIARIKDELEGEGYEIFVTPMDKKKRRSGSGGYSDDLQASPARRRT